VLIGAVVGAGIGILWPLSVTLLLAAIVAALFTAAGNALNDYFDAETDARNHPERPIPRGLLTRTGALQVSAVLFALAVGLALFLNLESFVIVLANLAVMVSYEARFKARGGSGNLLIAYLVFLGLLRLDFPAFCGLLRLSFNILFHLLRDFFNLLFIRLPLGQLEHQLL